MKSALVDVSELRARIVLIPPLLGIPRANVSVSGANEALPAPVLGQPETIRGREHTNL